MIFTRLAGLINAIPLVIGTNLALDLNDLLSVGRIDVANTMN